MVPDELLEELRGTWGPPPPDPARHLEWEGSLEVLAEVPQLLTERVIRDGTSLNSLLKELGSLEALAALEAECLECFLTTRGTQTLHDAVMTVTERPRWNSVFGEVSRLKRTRLRARLGEDISIHLKFLLITNARFTELFFA